VVPKTELEERLAFLSISDEDRRLLAEIRPLLERNADRLVSGFYRHLLSFEPTRQLLADPAVKERLLGKQREYLLSLAGSPIDDAYLDERRRIGQTHLRVGLQPRWYLGAYSLYVSLLRPLLEDAFAGEPQRLGRVLGAILKVIVFDAQLAMEAYIERRETQLEYLNRELASSSRALELEYEAQGETLRSTTRRARAAEDLASVATLVAGLAHEIGTPMSVIQGHAELLESAVTDARARQRLHTIRAQIDRISNIMQTLLNLARPHVQVRVAVDLRQLLDDGLAFVGEKLTRRGIAVERSFQDVASIRADGEKLQQLFLNLFLNAADAMPQGGTLRVALRPDGVDAVEIRVTDTGCGIAPADLGRLFEPFFTTKSAGEGSGLGLAVAQSIVHDHKGEIEAESEVGRGTEFRIRLPLTVS
jgi:signal transduction histidine kinase